MKYFNQLKTVQQYLGLGPEEQDDLYNPIQDHTSSPVPKKKKKSPKKKGNKPAWAYTKGAYEEQAEEEC